MGDQRYVPAALTRQTDRILNVQEAGWAPGPVWKISSPPLGFDPQTLRPVASPYSDYAVPDRTEHYLIIIIIIIITMQCNNNFTGKYLAIIGPKLSGPPGDPDYRGTIVYKQGKALPAHN